MQTRTLILAAGLALACAPARGEDRGSTYDPRVAFAEADANHDGVIDHAEFQERITFIFYRADANKDGFLDVIELKQLTFPEDFTENDKDKDGRVSLREFLRVRFHDREHLCLLRRRDSLDLADRDSPAPDGCLAHVKPHQRDRRFAIFDRHGDLERTSACGRRASRALQQ